MTRTAEKPKRSFDGTTTFSFHGEWPLCLMTPPSLSIFEFSFPFPDSWTETFQASQKPVTEVFLA